MSRFQRFINLGKEGIVNLGKGCIDVGKGLVNVVNDGYLPLRIIIEESVGTTTNIAKPPRFDDPAKVFKFHIPRIGISRKEIQLPSTRILSEKGFGRTIEIARRQFDDTINMTTFDLAKIQIPRTEFHVLPLRILSETEIANKSQFGNKTIKLFRIPRIEIRLLRLRISSMSEKRRRTEFDDSRNMIKFEIPRMEIYVHPLRVIGEKYGMETTMEVARPLCTLRIPRIQIPRVEFEFHPLDLAWFALCCILVSYVIDVYDQQLLPPRRREIDDDHHSANDGTEATT